jgi:hypothetical protein
MDLSTSDELQMIGYPRPKFDALNRAWERGADTILATPGENFEHSIA